MMHDDMADYFQRLRAVPALPPPPPPEPNEQRPAIIAANPPAAAVGLISTGPASTAKAKRKKGMKQLTLV